MALSKDSPRHYSVMGRENAMPVQASTTIYSGSCCTIDAGGEVGPMASADATFVGFARKKADNSSGAAGDIDARILTSGEVELTVTGLDDNNDLGDIVYAIDDDTFTLTASSTHQAIGKVSQIVSLTANKCRVAFKSGHDEHWND